jgi:virginiamycin B lyase
MKKQTKGIFFTVLFGGSLLFWASAATLPGIVPEDPESVNTVTGTPMDNYPDVQRVQFCGSEDTAKSNHYVKEFKIPTPCTQPLAITSDPIGNLLFTHTNTGQVA